MNNWEELFVPIGNFVLAEDFNRSQLSSNIDYFGLSKDFPDWDKNVYHLGIIGVGFDDSDLAANIYKTPDNVRYWLYRLFKGNYDVSIADFGNLSVKTSLDEVVNTLSDFLVELMSRRILPIIIGGGKELVYAQYLAYKKIGKFCNLVNVSSTLDFKDASDELTAWNFLSKVLSDSDNFLFNYSNIGYQTYFTPPELLELFRGFNFEMHRLGEVRSKMEDSEPVIRDADFLCMDLGSVKYADAPNCTFATPNGFTSDEICRLARYSGLSYKMSSVGFYGIKPDGKTPWTDNHLMAQCIWHFIEGFYLRKPESLEVDDHQYMKYTVAYQGYPDEINFYKNRLTEKWWMAVPVSEIGMDKYHIREYLVPCSESDYTIASMNEIPDRWLRTYKKLNQ